MRDFRDAKTMAQTIRATLAGKGVKISIGDSLELIATAFGSADWNTLAAAIKAAPKPEAKPVAPPAVEALDQLAQALGSPDWPALQAAILERRTSRPLPPGTMDPAEVRRRPVRFSDALVASLHRAIALANERRHQYVTLEHMLLAMLDDPDAAAVLDACQADIPALREGLVRYVDDDLKSLITSDGAPADPTAGFHRVVTRAVLHVQSSGRQVMTAANVLVAMFTEGESRAYALLEAHGVTRPDAVNFIAHGIRKQDAAA
jgi:hypothetical protein